MIDRFRKLGLTTNESRALNALISGKLTLKELIRRTGIPAGKAYSVAKSLIEKGLAIESDSRPKILSVESASAAIRKLIEKEQKAREDIIADLQRFASEMDTREGKRSSFFDFGPTNEDNRRIQMRTFTEAKSEVLQVLNVHHKPKSNRLSKTVWEKEIEKAIARGVVFRCIYPKKAVLPPILEKLAKKQSKNFQVRHLDLDYPRCDVIDGKKAMVKLVHEDPFSFGGIIFIENRDFAQNLRKVFDKFWEEAEKR